MRSPLQATKPDPTIHFAVQESWLGQMLVAASQSGICAILLGDDRNVLREDLRRRFAKADLREESGTIEQLLIDVADFVATPSVGRKLQLDLRGTVFQQLVWKALLEIPTGTTVSYTQIAQRVNRPQSVRAVAQAIGANPVAVAVPCHRVVRADGSLCGYRWGVQRKIQLLRREQQWLLDATEPSVASRSMAATGPLRQHALFAN